MAILEIVEATVQLVARGTRAKVISIGFTSHTTANGVILLDGGAAGTARFSLYAAATTNIGDNYHFHYFGEEGADFNDGLYYQENGVVICNIQYKPLI